MILTGSAASGRDSGSADVPVRSLILPSPSEEGLGKRARLVRARYSSPLPDPLPERERDFGRAQVDLAFYDNGEKEMNENDLSLRDHLLSLLRGANAHISFDDFVAAFPARACGLKVEGLPYTAWQVLEHIRIAQWDILEFCREAQHVSPKWPKGYWPEPDELGNEELWKETVEKIGRDLKQTEALVANPATDLFARIPHGTGQTILREALLVADHNAYHLGALAVMSRVLKNR
jgi:hypothetical protein